MENRLVVAKGEEGGRGMDWEFGVGRCKLLHLERIGTSLVAQWLRICLPMQGTRIRSLVQLEKAHAQQ